MSSPYPVLDNRPIDQWKVTELKEELKRRSLPVKGLKDDLIKRLHESIRQEESIHSENESVPEDDNNEIPSDNELNVEASDATVVSDVETANITSHDEKASETEDAAVVQSGDHEQHEQTVEAADKGATPLCADDKSTASQKYSVPEAEATGDKGSPTAAEESFAPTVPVENISMDSENSASEAASGKESLDPEIQDVKSDAGLAVQELGGTKFQKEDAPSPAQMENVDSKAKVENEGMECQTDAKDSKTLHGDAMIQSSNLNYQVPEVTPSLGIHIKSDSISTDCVSINEKNELKDDIIADNMKLELDNFKPMMVQPPSSDASQDDDMKHWMDVQELHADKVTTEDKTVSMVTIEESHADKVTTEDKTVSMVTIEESHADKIATEDKTVSMVTIEESHAEKVTTEDKTGSMATNEESHEDKTTTEDKTASMVIIEESHEDKVTTEDKPASMATIEELHEDNVTTEEKPASMATIEESYEDNITTEEKPASMATIEESHEDTVTTEDKPTCMVTIEESHEDKVTAEDKPVSMVTIEESQEDKDTIEDKLESMDTANGSHHNMIATEELDADNTNADASKENDNTEVVYSEKLNLDRSSGDDSMDEDALDVKQTDSKYNSDVVEDANEKPDVAAVEESIVGAYSSLGEKVVTVQNPVLPTVKRKPHEAESNNEVSKRQRRWNQENLTVPEPKNSDITPSTTPKDPINLKIPGHNLSRSDSVVSDEKLKERIVPPSQKSPTNSLRIDRFLRPFTLKAVHEFLGKTGTVTSFWMDQIKTHCYVTFSSVEEAVETRNAVFNLQWPPNGGRLLVADFVDPQEVKLQVEAPQASAPPLNVAPPPMCAPMPMPPHPHLPIPSPRNQISRQLPLPPPPPGPPLPGPPPVLRELPLPPPPPLPKKQEPSILTLDDLFKKTKAPPRIYYLPLSEEQVAAKTAMLARNSKP